MCERFRGLPKSMVWRTSVAALVILDITAIATFGFGLYGALTGFGLAALAVCGFKTQFKTAEQVMLN
jgi:hypothetical protein